MGIIICCVLSVVISIVVSIAICYVAMMMHFKDIEDALDGVLDLVGRKDGNHK